MRALTIAAVLLAAASSGGSALAGPHSRHVTRVADALRLCGPRPHAPGRYRCVGKPDRHEVERIEYVYEKIAEKDVKGGKTAATDWLAP